MILPDVSRRGLMFENETGAALASATTAAAAAMCREIILRKSIANRRKRKAEKATLCDQQLLKNITGELRS